MQNTIARASFVKCDSVTRKPHSAAAIGCEKAPHCAQPRKAALLASRASFGASRAALRSLQISSGCAAAAAQRFTVTAAALPPTLADTKNKFISAYSYPIPAVFNVILQELLCTMHFARYHKDYTYNPIIALGFASVFDQVFAEYKYGDSEAIFSAYVEALEETPKSYRDDAAALTAAASAAGTAEDLTELDAIKQLAASNSVHSKFLSIGIFRCLELAGITEPAALELVVKASGLKLDAVNRDLLTYKGLLSKLNVAKEMEKEFLEREKKQLELREEAAKAKEEKAAEEVVKTE